MIKASCSSFLFLLLIFGVTWTKILASTSSSSLSSLSPSLSDCQVGTDGNVICTANDTLDAVNTSPTDDTGTTIMSSSSSPLSLSSTTTAQPIRRCNVPMSVCGNSKNSNKTPSNNDKAATSVHKPSASSSSRQRQRQRQPSLYRYGGSAQAYKPHVPISNAICDPARYPSGSNLSGAAASVPYRTAHWPYSRSRRRLGAPRITLHIQIWSCGTEWVPPHLSSSSSSSSQREGEGVNAVAAGGGAHKTSNSWFSWLWTPSPRQKPQQEGEYRCCCTRLPLSSTGAVTSNSTNNQRRDGNTMTLELWQARPDGTYSSLRPGQQDSDCRTRIPLSLMVQDQDHQLQSSLVVETVAPGSTGILGGLGPAGYDSFYYGPPVLHVLLQQEQQQQQKEYDNEDLSRMNAYHHEPTLLEIPLLLDANTLQPLRFRWPDWRGPAMVRHVTEIGLAYNITTWNANRTQRHILIDMDLYWQQQHPQQKPPYTSSDAPQQQQQQQIQQPNTRKFCSSWLFGLLPSSFFVEPISICAPYLLDFFAL